MRTDTKSVRRTYRMSCVHKYSLIIGGDAKHRFRGASDHTEGQHVHQRVSNHLPQITTKRSSRLEGLLPPAAVAHQLRWRMAHSASALASLTSRHLSITRAAECRCVMAACVLTRASVFAFRYLTSSEDDWRSRRNSSQSAAVRADKERTKSSCRALHIWRKTS